MGRKRSRHKQLSNEEKITRQRKMVAALREEHGAKVVIFGYCVDCLLPLTVPGVPVPLHTTFEWDTESPSLLQKAPQYCVLEGCATRAVQRYQTAVREGVVIRGTYSGPDVSEDPLDKQEGS